MNDDSHGSPRTDSDDDGQDRNKPVIVAIGASAGGVGPLQELFSALPDRTGAAYVVIVHLDPEHRSELAQVLAARARMPVVQINNRQRLEADHVYVIPPDRRLQVIDHEVSATAFDEPRGQRTPIDLFFRSMAERLGGGFAMVLSGAGSDGTIGVRAVKEAGGIILVQDPEEAEYDSMPRSAIATGVADVILPVRDLAKRLHDLIRIKKAVAVPTIRNFDEELLRRILAHLRVRTGHDFSKYKRSTVLRRIARRMNVVRADDLDAYYEALRERPDEAQALLGDLLISVTTFFRDPEAFEFLAREALPNIFKDKESDDPVRVWVAGCATGEEAYTLAMLLLEEAARQPWRRQLQVFGSDLDARALAAARDGRFPAAIENDVSEDRLRRFFVQEGDHYRIRQDVRDTVLFAMHDLLKDPPFSHVDLISCRNVLIYLDRELQEQACSTFHYALRPGGYLFTGPSESAENPAGLFRAVDRNARIYRSTAVRGERPRLLPRLIGSTVRVREHTAPAVRVISPTMALGEATIHRRALEQVAPPSMLVDDSHRVVHLSENAGRFVLPSGGPLSGDAADLVRQELRFDVRAALTRAFELGESTLSLAIPVRFNGTRHRVYIQVKPVQESGEAEPRNALVLFIEGGAIEERVAAEQHASDDIVRRLAEELEMTQSRLRTVREEAEASNEELRAANEELQSINEEYRSTSEELETSKEELQSLNEELSTVNTELKLKLDVISRAHSDLQNLVTATEIGTLFLDTGLHIKRFTDRVTDLFSLAPTDEGRPITDFSHRLEYEDLVKDARAVLSDLAPVRREIRSRAGRWYDVRLRPYRTVDNKIDGVVITFVDISERHQVEEALRRGERRQGLLLGELTHRVRNILAVIQAIARQTMASSASKEEFVKRLEGRLSALAIAHTLLVQSEWRGADLRELAHQQLDAYASDGSDRLHVEGEPISLPADLATPFGLVLHELATNAAKHGALSRPGGKVFITWRVEVGNNQRQLRFLWKETGGPSVIQPEKHGFGSSLIDSGIPGATVKRDFPPEGLVCSIVLVLPESNDNESAG